MGLADKIEQANSEALDRIYKSNPILVDIKKAIDVIPGFHKNLILHAGPPLNWDEMTGPVRGAIIGTLIYENIIKNSEEAETIIKTGKIEFAPCHHYNAVGPMAGIISASMPVYVIKNETFGNYAYCTINEGLGKVLRFGAFDNEVIQRLHWLKDFLAPALKTVIDIAKSIPIKPIITQALLMGDECHNRNVAATTIFTKELEKYILETDLSKKEIKEVLSFLNNNPHTFLNISMAACKSITDTIKGIKYCSIVYAMARNGTNIGIRVAGLGEEWFIAPSGLPKGLYFPNFSENDANPDLGDSTITETAGLGAMAMAAAPAIVKFVGGSAYDAINYTKQMYEITAGRHPEFLIPYLNFSGTPVGIDIRKVVQTGITPVINTGIAHKKPGIGQIGAGILKAPFEIFASSLRKFSEIYHE